MLGINSFDIKKGAKILDIDGLYDASTEFNGIKMDPVSASQTATSLTSSIREISGLDMTNGTNLSRYFNGLYNLTMVSNLNTPNVVNMQGFCDGCASLQNFSYVNMYGDTQTNVNIAYIFNGCTNLEKLDDTVKLPKSISNISRAFQYCYNLNYIDSEINATNVLDMYGVFNMCNSLITINNLKLPKNKPIGFEYTFYNCQNLDISNIDFVDVNADNSFYTFSGVKNINDMTIDKLFKDTEYFHLDASAFSNTSVSSIPNFAKYDNIVISSQAIGVFSNCNNINVIDYNMSTNATNLSSWLANCMNLETVNFGLGNRVNNMYSMFYGCSNLKTVNLYTNTQNTNNDIKFSRLVCECNNLTSFNMSNSINTVNECSEMFYNCNNLNSVNLKFDNIIGSAAGMFYNCFNLQTFSFGNATFDTIEETAEMFVNCYNLTSIGTTYLNMHNFNGSAANMFLGCHNLTGDIVLDITNGSPTSAQNNIFMSSGFDNISFYFDYYSNRRLNMFSMISDCQNLKTANLSINSFNNRAISAEIQIVSCSNLIETNANLLCESNDMILTYSNCNNLSNAQINVQIKETSWIRFERCNNLHNVDIYTNNTSNLDLSIYNSFIYNLPNITSFNMCNIMNLDLYGCNYINNTISVNYNKVQKISALRIYNSYTTENISINLPNCNNISSFEIYNCINLVDLSINLVNVNNITRMNIYNARNLSDNSYDNILGILSNVNYGSAKYITNVFTLSNKDSSYWETLPNYTNLISAGWKI